MNLSEIMERRRKGEKIPLTAEEKESVKRRQDAGSPFLRTKGMLVKVEIKSWSGLPNEGGKKKAKTSMLPNAEDLGPWNAAVEKMKFVMSACLVASDDIQKDAYFLRAKNFQHFKRLTDQVILEADTAKKDFTKKYPAILKEGKARVGEGFDKDNYPATKEIEEYFGIKIEYAPLPKTEDEKKEEASAEKKELIDPTETEAEPTVEERMQQWS